MYPDAARKAAIRAVALVTLGLALGLLALAGGALDRFSGAAGIPVGLAVGSLLLYWALACALIVGVALSCARPAQMLLAVLGFALGVAIFEAALRLAEVPAGFPEWDGVASRTNHHLYPPDRKMYAGVHGDEPVFVVTNEDGLRSPYDREAFRAFGTRVAVLGDSFTFGLGVPGESAMPAQLERGLRARTGNPDLAVLNAGIVSYSPLLEKLLFDDIVRHYDPQIVLLVLDPSDIGDDHQYAREAALEDGRTVFPPARPECGDSRTRYYGATFELLRPRLRALAPPLLLPLRWVAPNLALRFGEECRYDYYDFRLEIGGAVETNRFFLYRHPLDLTRPYFDASFEQVREAAAAVRATGARFALLVSPRFHHWNPREAPHNWESEAYARDEPWQYEYFRYFEGARSRVDFPIRSLLPAFRSTRAFPLVFENDPHWNPRGHAVAARAVADFLLRAGWLAPE